MRTTVFALASACAAGTQTVSTQGAQETPVSRVVNLLKEMATTIEAEQAEDKTMYKKLKCWCNDGAWEKGNAKEASENKIAQLESAIEAGTARSAELNQQIKDLDAQVASNTQSLSDAQANRNKELKTFHAYELDAIQNVENMKAALTVLGAAALVQEDTSFLAIKRSSTRRTMAKTKDWTQEHEASHMGQGLEEFLRRDGIVYTDATLSAFLQQDSAQEDSPSARAAAHSAQELAVVRKAMKTMKSFLQRQGEGYMPAYESSSGEILGVMKQLKEEMESDLKEAQKTERDALAAFDELRADKTQEIEDGEKMSEKKEDELATTDNDLAEAKEDLGQEQTSLQETTTFLANLETTCGEAEKNFEARTQARADEGKAVSETIEILTSDEARDTMSATYSFLQVSSEMRQKRSRTRAAARLRRAAASLRDPRLALLATHVELDAFTKVKKSIDDMIGQLKVQQADEVKKNDWCTAELQSTEMTTLKTEDLKGDLEAKEAKLESDIKALKEGIEESKKQIAELTVDLQRANENRKQENLDFQKTVADQILTVQILKKALDKLASHYDLLQQRQTPPVAQGEFKKSAGAGGVMQMIEKLVQDAQAMTADSRKAEQEAQEAYEQVVADTNGSIEGLQAEVVTKGKNKAKTTKHSQQTAADIKDTMKELEGLSTYTGDLHKDCDYLIKNFQVRQDARAKETEALQQAKQILSGASLGF